MSSRSLTIAAIRQPSFIYDADGRIAEANNQAEALAGRSLAGCTAAAVVGIFNIRAPDGTPLMAADLPAIRVLAGEDAVDVPLVITASDGRTMHVLATASPLRDGAEVVGAFTVWQDVSAIEAALARVEVVAEELQAEKEELRRKATALAGELTELDRQRQLLDAILGTLPHRVSVWDRDQRLVWVSERLAAERGWPRERLVGRSWRELGVDMAVAGQIVEDALPSLSDGRPFSREIEVAGPVGPVWRAFTILPIFGDSILVITDDVTERHRAEEALTEDERRHAFLLALGDRLRELAGVSEVTAVASEMLGRHLGVNGVVFCEVDAAGEWATVLAGWTDGTVPCGADAYRLDDFGTGDIYRRGFVRRTVDYEEGEITMCGARGVRASLGVPICRGGRLTAVMTVYSARPRVWTDAEVELVRQVGDRVWASAERARAEVALRESEERLRLAQESAGVGIWDRDAATDRVTISPGFLRRYGLEAEAIASYEDWERLIHPDDREQVEAGRRATFAAGTPLDLEFRVVLPLGDTRWIQFKGQGVRDRQGGLVRVLGVLIDVTDRRRVEDALRESEERLRLAQESANVAVWDWDMSTGAITFTPEFLRPYGVSADSIRDYDAWRRLVHPEDIEQAEAERNEAIARGEPFSTEFRVVTPSGDVRWLAGTGHGVRDAHSRLIRIIGANQDITERKEAEAERARFTEDLQRSNEELQRFAYVASHDLQEPLRSIISFSQLLERRYKGKLDADADEFIAFIVEGGCRMQRLIMDLLQLSRVEMKAKPLAPTDAGQIAADVVRSMETPIQESGAAVTVEALPRVMADAAQLAQVFTNLIGNALKYRRSDVPLVIRVSAERAGKFWRFAVADNGIGIEPEYFDRIFQMFQRLHTRDEYEGTGIGLAVVRKIVERHGGRVSVESVPGEGSTFYFTLPAA